MTPSISSSARAPKGRFDVASMRQRFYPDRVQRDPVATFVRRVEREVKPADRVLDLGAGGGELNAYALRGKVRQVVGIDLDPRVESNALLDAGLRADIYALPFRNASFDVVFSIYVLEHINRPSALVSEIQRVLKPNGICLVLTPNAFHYVTLASRVTPMVFHRWVNRRRGRASEDTFPTRYRLNSARALRRAFGAAGMSTVAIDAIEVQPNYLTFSPFAYAAGIVYERLVNATDLGASLRVNLIGMFRKTDAR